MSEPVIQSLVARRIWDSRGRPTIEAEVALSDGATGRGIAPAGASRGSREAIDKRDGDKRFGGLDVQDALRGITEEIAPALIGLDPFDQAAIDAKLIGLDGTPNKARLGGNALTAVSLACFMPRPQAEACRSGAISWARNRRSFRSPRSRSLAAARMPDGAPTSRISWSSRRAPRASPRRWK